MEKDCSARLRRAVQENNLFLVKRLVQRTDVNMRNPDPGHSWYTSLAWAAVLGHEETFEFLLNANHDDRELSKDADDNTILMMLAEVKIQKKSVFGYGPPPIDMAGATLRMARLYLERYPFVLDWSNSSGKTALHVASLKGREDFVRMFCDFGADVDLPDEEGNTPLHYASAWGHIPIVQLLIERGCQYNTQNNEGFTPSDYAYSISTRDTLQDTARNQFESNKKARRVFAQAAARGKEWSSGEPSSQPGDATRLRRGSGTSGHASGSGSDVEGTPSAPPYATYSGALPTSLSHLNGSTSSSSSFTLSSAYRNGTPVHPPLANHASPLTPIATRTLQQDADAMEKYMRRNRSGSASTDIKSLSSNPSSAGPSANGDDISSLPLSGSVGPRRKLRPSVSAAQLRNTKPQSGSTTPDGTRLRSGTSTTNVRANPPTFSPPLDSRGLPPLPSRTHSRSNGISVPEHGPEAFIGPPSEYAKFPAPPPTKESVVANSTLLGGSTASSIVTSPTTSRRLPLNLFSKPLPSIDQAVGHRRGSSSHSIR